MRSIRLPSAPPQTSASGERPDRIADAGGKVQTAENEQRDDRQDHEDVARMLTDMQTERRPGIVHQREPHPVTEDVVRQSVDLQAIRRDRLRTEVDRGHQHQHGPE